LYLGDGATADPDRSGISQPVRTGTEVFQHFKRHNPNVRDLDPRAMEARNRDKEGNELLEYYTVSRSGKSRIGNVNSADVVL
jgi:hypothetical protein